MKLGFKVIVVTIVVIVSVQCANAQWVQVSGPGPTSVTAFAVNGTELFAGTDGNGLFRSTDDGLTWRSMNGSVAYGTTGLLHTNLRSVYVSGTRILAGTYSGGLYSSTNDGVTWTRAASPVGTGASINGIIKVDTVIIAGGAGAWRSLNNGSTWVTATTGMTNTNIRSMGVNGTTAFACTDNGVFKSTDLGATWIDANTGLNGSPKYTSGFTSFGGTLYVIHNNGTTGKTGVFRSTNNGASWDTTGASPNSSSPISLFSYADTLLAGHNGYGVYRSTDKGMTWNAAATGGTMYPITLFAAKNRVFAGGNSGLYSGDGGVFISDNKGTSWSRPVGTIMTGTIRSLAQIGNRLLAGVGNQNNNGAAGVYQSTDRGFTWTKTSTGLTANGNSVSANSFLVKKNKVFIAGSTNVPNGVFASSDSGLTWASASTGLYQYATVNQFLADGDTIYIAAKEGLFRSTNDGGSWSAWGTGMPSGDVKSIIMRGDTMYAGKGTSVLYRSEDRGRTWKGLTTNLPQYYYVFQLYATDSKLFTLGSDANGRLFQSADSGRTWTESDAAKFTGNGLILSMLTKGKTLIACTNAAGIYISTNEGSTWTQYNQGINYAYPTLNPALVAGEYLYTGYGASVQRRMLTELGITSVRTPSHGQQPNSITLSQNYPNPFNPSTTITYDLPDAGVRHAVKLRVYDMLGRVVATLVNEAQSAGAHAVTFNASHLSTGLYLYRLEADGMAITKRMLLVK